MVVFRPSPERFREEEFKPRKLVRIKELLEGNSWEPKRVKASPPPSVCFVDGVRRTEYRTAVFSDDGRFAGEGIFLSLGAGALLVNTERGDFEVFSPLVERFFVHNTKDENIPETFSVEVGRNILNFKSIPSRSDDISAFGNLLMRELEKKVAAKVLKEKKTFLVMDGTVKLKRFFPNAVHLVKDGVGFYDREEGELLLKLKKGERSPLFLFEEPVTVAKKGFSERKIKKVGCYVKLSDGPFTDPFASIVRLEMPLDGDTPPGRMVKTFERGAAAVLRYANDPLRDPRAPKNLTTVAFLEKELRRRLGRYESIRAAVLRTLLG
jgi:hypothetical protein